MMRLAGQAQHRRSRLNSNVRALKPTESWHRRAQCTRNHKSETALTYVVRSTPPWSQSMRALVLALLVIASHAASRAADVVAPQPFEATTVVAGKDGLWIVGNATGRVRYCVATKEATSTYAKGNCGALSSVGPSSSGYEVKSVGSDLFIVNKTSGAIQLCSPIADKAFARGNCQQISTLDRAQEPNK